jgi:hypothetical protein
VILLGLYFTADREEEPDFDLQEHYDQGGSHSVLVKITDGWRLRFLKRVSAASAMTKKSRIPATVFKYIFIFIL